MNTRSTASLLFIIVLLLAHFPSKGKITFQSFFMLITVQPLFLASAMSSYENVPIFESAPLLPQASVVINALEFIARRMRRQSK
jgi:hypothetical protein